MKLCKETMVKSGEKLALRSMTAADAQAVLWIMRQCMGETDFMARYPDEMRFTVSQEAEFIESANANPNGLLMGAFLGDALVGICSALPVAPNERYRHRASMGIMIAKAHWGKGIGGAMMRALIEAMKETAVEQIELDVVSGNETAIALYRKFGFVQYGLLEHGMKYRDGGYADLVLMKLDLTDTR